MSALGIYFGPRIISIVETGGNKLIKSIKIPWPAILGSGASEEEKVPEEIKLAILIKDELTKNKIEAKEATVSLSGKDLIIRTFEMPVLPEREMADAINFESKKYIPFKLEELISDSRWKTDKILKKNRVLYVGSRQEILNKYISVLSQLNIKIKAIEYCAFSILRLLKLSNIKGKGISAVFNLDLLEDDEANFVVLENGFPLFSRDITLSAIPQESEEPLENQVGRAFDKLKREIRISLDYYHRKFLTKKIAKTFFISGQDYRLELEAFIKEIGLSIEFIEVAKYIEGETLSLSIIKGYAASISRLIRTDFTIDLFAAAKHKLTSLKEAPVAKRQILRLPAGLNIESKILALGLLICFLVFIYGLFQINTTKKSLQSEISVTPGISILKPDTADKELTAINIRYKGKAIAIDNLKTKRVYLTELLDAIPRVIPDNIWLSDLSFELKKENKAQLNLHGFAYLGNSNQEFELVNSLRAKLRENPVFNKYFKDTTIASLDRGQKNKNIVTNFLISSQK